MSIATVAALLLLLVGASVLMAGVLRGAPSPRPSATPTPSAEPPSPTAHPEPSASPRAAFGCSLPVLVADGTFPRPRAWLDPDTGALVREPPAVGDGFYSLAAHRWLPVGRSSIAPDGLSYAYVEFVGFNASDRLHVVDALSGRDATYTLEDKHAYSVLEYGTDGIYLMFAYEMAIGVWRFDLASHALTQLSDQTDVWVTDGRVLWAGSVNPADPAPVAGLGVAPNQVDRIDLGSGARETWLYRPHTEVRVFMTDAAGLPVAWAAPGQPAATGYYLPGEVGDLVYLDRPGHAVTLHSGRWEDLQPGAVDEHGLWFGGKAGVYLLRPGASALEPVASAPVIPAGGCH